MSERDDSYREHAVVCPGCGATMTTRVVEGAGVSLCEGCGGAYFDWFDGEVLTLAKGLGDLPAPPSIAVGSKASCPRCRVVLATESFKDTDVVVRRCPECMGLFIPKRALAAIAAMPYDEPSLPPPPPEEELPAFQRWVYGVIAWMKGEQRR